MDIHTIDHNFQGVPETIASYVIQEKETKILIETGPRSSLPTVLAELDKLNINPTDIKHVLVTHIHLDHAGAAGWWAEQGAHIYVHPFGLKHMIDPSRLMASARRIYQEKMDSLWGEMVPIPEDKITAVNHNDILQLGDITVKVVETVGHARHHHAYIVGDHAFIGDACGIVLDNFPLLSANTPPPDVDLEGWEVTLDRLSAVNPTYIYPTHFGRHENPQKIFADYRVALAECSQFVKTLLDVDVDRETIIRLYTDWHYERAMALGVSEANWTQFLTASPLDMCVDGLIRYWRKKIANSQ